MIERFTLPCGRIPRMGDRVRITPTSDHNPGTGHAGKTGAVSGFTVTTIKILIDATTQVTFPPEDLTWVDGPAEIGRRGEDIVTSTGVTTAPTARLPGRVVRSHDGELRNWGFQLAPPDPRHAAWRPARFPDGWWLRSNILLDEHGRHRGKINGPDTHVPVLSVTRLNEYVTEEAGTGNLIFDDHWATLERVQAAADAMVQDSLEGLVRAHRLAEIRRAAPDTPADHIQAAEDGITERRGQYHALVRLRDGLKATPPEIPPATT